MKKYTIEPYRICFPLGTIFFLMGILLWIPQLFNSGDYPVNAHRFLMLNGFTGCFICGFLMTAVPKFSQTIAAKNLEVFSFVFVTCLGVILSFIADEKIPYLFSVAQSVLLLSFLFFRISKRRQNPPYSFIFIFIGLFLWIVSGLGGFLLEPEDFKRLHYEGAISAIILGVGARLIPGILGHTEVVMSQRRIYEQPVSLIKTVPLHFFLLITGFIVSYFLPEAFGDWLRVAVVSYIAFFNFQLHKFPQDQSALTWSIWLAAWLFSLSFFLRSLFPDAGIHISHSLFINGIALLSFLIATRVLQSHGPKIKELENRKVIYVVTGLVVLAAATRISAYYMPDGYQHHLGYSSLVLTSAVILWSKKYLKYAWSF